MPVLDFAQEGLNVFGHRAFAQVGIENRNHCGRDLVVVGKISPCSRLGVNPAVRGSSEEPSWILGQ